MLDEPVVQAKMKTTTDSGRSMIIIRLIQVGAFTGLWTAALFGSAGRFDWTRGWICVAMYALSMAAAGFQVCRSNPALVEARAKWWRKDTKRFDKVFLSIYFPLTFIQPAVAGLDAVRFGWSSIPFGAVYPGAFLFIIAMILIIWTMVVNPYAESTVRIQWDRGHIVVTSGPYRIVRHPMYVGAILMFPATALILGSMWALATSALIAILIICRTAFEDRTLRRELPGYEEYTAVTRYRLVPRLW